MKNISIAEVSTPLGRMIGTTSADLLTGLWYPEHVATRFEGPIEQVGRGGAVVASLEKELQRYFDGELRQFTVPTAITHSPEALAQLPGTELQKAVWWQVAQVGFGELTTYGQIAREIGRPGASRPVGQAVGRNPISIVVGCHRVVGAGGKITGYAGGLERKRKLLHIEGHSGY
ncbi:methylated-DNA--[protein]-cysteine S-methyltransferase [Corynebacterium auriscanis]|uniref:methylated-DNA--[protein]-cysteine S-methyltransferase n=1 Tax=Corynebacterium auriscanis TaxID=99807 RepID=UPI003CE861C6